MGKGGKKPKKQKGDKFPSDMGISPSPVGYGKPPVEHQVKPGEVKNPKGRPTAGATIREWLNVLAEQQLTIEALRKIHRSESEPWPKRMAALRVMRGLEDPDLADYSGLLSGENKLEDLRAMGVNTAAIKKFKQKTRKVPVGENEVEEVIDREIELHDRSGVDFDRVVEHTDGTAIKKVDVSNDDGSLRTPSDGAIQAAAILAELGLAARTPKEDSGT